MTPDLEVVKIAETESFKAWEHGYPYHTVRWHFHPECELHLVSATNGTYFVGDFIGQFEPGNLVLTGPNLPHNWVSDVPEGVQLPLRCRIVQFKQSFFADAAQIWPELSEFGGLLEISRRGALFDPATAASLEPYMAELVNAQGIRRLELFMGIVRLLVAAPRPRPLASERYLPDPSGFMSAGVNKALAYIDRHLTEPFTETDLANLTGQSQSAFSRLFRRHTGMSLVLYVNRLRVNYACHLLMSNPDMPITEVCYASGFNNISNFNRQFLSQKKMSPSQFRAWQRLNKSRPIAA